MYDSASGSVGVKPATVKSGPGILRGWYILNPNVVTVYLQIFDKKSDAVTNVGTDIPMLSLGIPAGAAANALGECVKEFGNGIVVAASTTRAGAVAPAIMLDVNIFFC